MNALLTDEGHPGIIHTMKITRNVKPDFIDERGCILRPLNDIIKEKIRSVSIITSNGGMIRGNHYHKKETHYMYIVEGKMDYYEKLITKPKSKPKKVSLKKGDMVYTSALYTHAVKFHTSGTVIYFSTAHRTKKGDLGDTFKEVVIS